jgi:hypothetical protein
MDNEKWPALSVEGVFLGANLAFLLAGRVNAYIITSLTLVLFLYTIQSISDNPRFLYLFPWSKANNVPTPQLGHMDIKRLDCFTSLFFLLGRCNFLLARVPQSIYRTSFPSYTGSLHSAV